MSNSTATYHLRATFFTYDSHFLMTHLNSYIKTIMRNKPDLEHLDLPSMQINHTLLQFQSLPETKISAFQLFPLEIQLIHAFQPSQLYFQAALANQTTLFPGSITLQHPLQEIGSKTLLALNTQTGTLPVPSHYDSHQKESIQIFNLNLSLCLESLQFAEAPFLHWKAVEQFNGNLHFPNTMSILAALPAVQNFLPPNILFPPHQPKNLRWSTRPVENNFDHHLPRNYRPLPSNLQHHAPEFDHTPQVVSSRPTPPSSHIPLTDPVLQPSPTTQHQPLQAAYPDTVAAIGAAWNNQPKNPTYREDALRNITQSLQGLNMGSDLNQTSDSIATPSIVDRLDSIRDLSPPTSSIQSAPFPIAPSPPQVIYTTVAHVHPSNGHMPARPFYRGVQTPTSMRPPFSNWSAPPLAHSLPRLHHPHVEQTTPPQSTSSDSIATLSQHSDDLISTTIPPFHTPRSMEAVVQD